MVSKFCWSTWLVLVRKELLKSSGHLVKEITYKMRLISDRWKEALKVKLDFKNIFGHYHVGS